jgi:type III secretory pathway component EscT
MSCGPCGAVSERVTLGSPAIMSPSGFLDAISLETSASGESLVAWGTAWARVLPTALAVPAFGLGFLPASLRVAMGFGLAVSVAPALSAAVLPVGVPWPMLVVGEIARGVPVAIVAATALFVATVAGGVTDAAFGTKLRALGAPFGRDGGPFATLLGLAAAILFLDGGGATRIASRLAEPALGVQAPLASAVRDLAAGIEVGASIGAPLLVVVVVIDVTLGLAVREFGALRLETVGAPLRALAVLVGMAALFERMAEGITLFGAGRP